LSEEQTAEIAANTAATTEVMKNGECSGMQSHWNMPLTI